MGNLPLEKFLIAGYSDIAHAVSRGGSTLVRRSPRSMQGASPLLPPSPQGGRDCQSTSVWRLGGGCSRAVSPPKTARWRLCKENPYFRWRIREACDDRTGSPNSVELSEPFGSWRIAPEGERIVARRCSCPRPLLDRTPAAGHSACFAAASRASGYPLHPLRGRTAPAPLDEPMNGRLHTNHSAPSNTFVQREAVGLPGHLSGHTGSGSVWWTPMRGPLRLPIRN